MNLLKALTGFTCKEYETIDDIMERQEEAYTERLSQTMPLSNLREKHILSQEFANLHSVNILSFNYTALFDILEVESPCFYNNVHTIPVLYSQYGPEKIERFRQDELKAEYGKKFRDVKVTYIRRAPNGKDNVYLRNAPDKRYLSN